MQGKSLYPPIFLLLILVISGGQVLAQSMNSPYSVYGIGDIDFKKYNRTSGMGGAGLATMSEVFLVDNNPAALSGLQNRYYLFNAALSGKFSTYSGDPVNYTNRSNRDAWMKGLSFSVKIYKFWGSSVGFSQYSNVNYKYTGSQFIEGAYNSLDAIYEGNGGLNDFYWTNAFAIGKHFSAGVKTSYIGGSINQNTTIENPAAGTSLTSKQQDYYKGLKLEYGAIYHTHLGKQFDLSIGGTFSNKTNLTVERTLNVEENGNTLVTDKLISYGNYDLPMTYGAGITLKHRNRTTFSLDYTYEDWSSLKVNNSGWKLVSGNRIAAGIQRSWFAQRWGGGDYEKRFLQAGMFLNRSYLQVKDQQINNFGFTAGYGGSLRNNLLYTLSAEVGQRGTTANKLIKENYVQFTLALTYRDYLFTKGRRYD
jgi:hypothetical protein